MLHIFDELLSKEEKKEEENEEKKEEKNEGKKGKKKKKGKKSRGAKSVEIHGSRDIFASAPESISELDVHSRTSSQFQNTSNNNKCILDDKSQRIIAVSYGMSVTALKKEDRDSLVMICQENDLYLFS